MLLASSSVFHSLYSQFHIQDLRKPNHKSVHQNVQRKAILAEEIIFTYTAAREVFFKDIKTRCQFSAINLVSVWSTTSELDRSTHQNLRYSVFNEIKFSRYIYTKFLCLFICRQFSSIITDNSRAHTCIYGEEDWGE